MTIQHQITIQNHTLPYTLNQSSRLKRLSMRRTSLWELIVNQPKLVSTTTVQHFLKTKQSWILKHYLRFQKRKTDTNLSTSSRQHFLEHKEQALALAIQKVEQWWQVIPYDRNTIRVKQLKTKRGSCSSKRNLNFNYKILFLPEHLQDYLVVHEMCHLKEMNHSHRFWALVEQRYWDRKDARRQLKHL